MAGSSCTLERLSLPSQRFSSHTLIEFSILYLDKGLSRAGRSLDVESFTLLNAGLIYTRDLAGVAVTELCV